MMIMGTRRRSDGSPEFIAQKIHSMGPRRRSVGWSRGFNGLSLDSMVGPGAAYCGGVPAGLGRFGGDGWAVVEKAAVEIGNAWFGRDLTRYICSRSIEWYWYVKLYPMLACLG